MPSWIESPIPSHQASYQLKNKIARFVFAENHVIWTDYNWSKVHFSDENKFNLVISDGH